MSQAEPPVCQDAVTALVLEMRALDAPGAKPGKEQRQFNARVKESETLRATLARWQDIVPALERRVALEIEPLFARYRERRFDIALRWRAAIDGGELGRREQAKAREILCWHVAELLRAEPRDELIALHDQYAEIDYDRRQATRAAAAEREEVLHEHDAHDAHDRQSRARARSTPDDAPLQDDDDFDFARRAAAHKRAAQAALGAQLAANASSAVRDIYRKLASALHPDREFDVAQRQRKTALMQDVNQAYARDDLLTLLALQLQLAQIDGQALALLPRERLRQYNHLLGEQCRQLRATLAQLTAPYLPSATSALTQLSEEEATRGLDREVRQLKRAIKACEAELLYLRDMRHVKALLDDYRLGELDD